MTDEDPQDNGAPAGAERLIEALRSAATDAATRETLRELGDRARGVVEDLARNARSRAEAAGARAAAEAERARREREAATGSRQESAAFVPPELVRKLEDLNGCIIEVADTLEATVERLETIELQLGDPDERLEARLARGLEDCEQVLRGLEHRVATASAVPAAAEFDRDVTAPAVTVMVVSPSSARRASLCVDLERQGLRCIAVSGPVAARRRRGDGVVSAAVLCADEDSPALADTLEDWKEGQEQGSLPPAILLDDTRDGGLSRKASLLPFSVTSARHGAAALAAGLMRVANAPVPPASTPPNEEQ